MGTLKVVLVNPPSPPEFRVSRGLMGGFGMAVNPELLYPPIELAHVAGLLESEGHEVVIVDGDALGIDAAGALERIRAMEPDVCVLDSSSTSLDQDLELAGRVREVTGALTGMLG
ncbi:MAG: anaerobic magnesium-protoporphyrin IX monomethyl ester cyclase, partial [Planctomycetota bacterium]